MPASALARLHRTEKLLLITSPYSNYSSLGTAVSPGTGTEVRRETMAMEGGISCNSLTWGNWKHIGMRGKTGYLASDVRLWAAEKIVFSLRKCAISVFLVGQAVKLNLLSLLSSPLNVSTTM